MRFYVLDSVVGSSDETEFEEVAPVHLGDAPKCPKCGLFVGAKPWLPPYRAIVKGHGEHLGDVAFGAGSSLLVSDCFRHVWQDAGLRGLALFSELDELSIRPPKAARTPVSFFHIRIERFGTTIDEGRSVIERDEPWSCDLCRTGGSLTGVRGFSIAESTWSGEDIFYAWGLPGVIVVTEPLVELAASHGLKNIHVTAVGDYLWDPLRRRAP